MNLGPQHPATHGVLRVKLTMDGEYVVRAEPVCGYIHRMQEKMGENRTYAQFNPYVDRMDYVAAVSNGLGYCLAVEKVLNVEAPPRAQAVRVILPAQRTKANSPHDGGWRYHVAGGDADLSITGWQVAALRAAKDAGCEVPAEAFEKALAFVRRCRDFDFYPCGIRADHIRGR